MGLPRRVPRARAKFIFVGRIYIFTSIEKKQQDVTVVRINDAIFMSIIILYTVLSIYIASFNISVIDTHLPKLIASKNS